VSWLEVGEKNLGGVLAERVRDRLERRVAAGVVDRDEIARVSGARARLFDPGGIASEAFRRACLSWRIDAPVTLRSHRPWIGGVLVAVKRLVARLLRFHVEVPLARQAEFNRNLLVVLHELVDRLPPRDERRDRPGSLRRGSASQTTPP
jgi:hypothetical protein